MKSNINFSEIAAQLVKVFQSEDLSRDYNEKGELYDGVCGWCGVMAPLSRVAYFKTFGPIAVLKAETKAREVIKAIQERHAMTKYHAHELEANSLQGVPSVGGFFWAINSGLKCDGGRGVFDEIASLIWCTEDDDEHSRKEFAKRPARLCQAREVYRVTPDEFDRPELADDLVTRHALQGGSASDDVADGTTWQQIAYDEEERATIYTFGALVTDGVRYYLIDSEGYDYSRYIYVPITWRENLRSIVEGERERIRARKEAEAKQEADDKAARYAEYKSRCNKWAHLMEDVRPMEKKEAEAFEAYTRTGWKSKSPEGKAHTAAKRATDAARKRNILAMCSAAFPGVKFSVSVRRGWGADFCIKWTDGPTSEEFKKAADIDLFASRWDTFDGMTDCAGVAHAEFTEFSSLTMGDRCGGSVEVEREISEEAISAAVAEIVDVVPEYAVSGVAATPSQAAAVADRLGVSPSLLYAFGYYATAREIACRYCFNTSFYKRTEEPTDPEPTKPRKGNRKEVDTTAAPADGLQLVEIVGGVAVVGDNRTTYRNRKEIKAHGATWNKTAQRWEATESDKVAQLRAWFALDEQTTEATAEASTEAVAPAEGHGVELNAEGLEALRQKFAEIEAKEAAEGATSQAVEADTFGAPAEGQDAEESEAVTYGTSHYSACENSAILGNLETPDPSGYSLLTGEAVRNEAGAFPEGHGMGDDRYPVGAVWQYTQRTGAGDFLHEIRKRADRFDLVVNIYNSEGDGQMFPDKFPTYAAAYEALIRFRPGSRLFSSPYLSSDAI